MSLAASGRQLLHRYERFVGWLLFGKNVKSTSSDKQCSAQSVAYTKRWMLMSVGRTLRCANEQERLGKASLRRDCQHRTRSFPPSQAPSPHRRLPLHLQPLLILHKLPNAHRDALKQITPLTTNTTRRSQIPIRLTSPTIIIHTTSCHHLTHL